jgi:hypothetical protein
MSLGELFIKQLASCDIPNLRGYMTQVKYDTG